MKKADLFSARAAILSACITGVMAVPSLVKANGSPVDMALEAASHQRQLDTPTLSLDPHDTWANASATSTDKDTAVDPITQAANRQMLTLDAGGSASKIHGFGALQFSNAYITPRGLNVQNAGLVVQPIFGLIFDLYDGDGPINNVSWLTGAWTSLHSHHPGADLWNEFDVFGGPSITFMKDFTFSATWEAWMFPDGAPDTEYNVEFKLAYDDSKLLGDFAVHPYVNIFYNYEGPSPVVAGTSHTFYGEVGLTPSYTLKAISDYPITFTLPMYLTVGDSDFWGNGFGHTTKDNLGVASVGVKASVPLKFIPAEYGSWNYYIGLTAIYTCNGSLSYVNNNVMGAGDSRTQLLAYTGIGFGF